jgi:hypothetical protein
VGPVGPGAVDGPVEPVGPVTPAPIVAEGDGATDPLGELLGEGAVVVLGVGEGLGLTEGLADGDTEGDGLGVTTAVGLGLSVGAGVALTDGAVLGSVAAKAAAGTKPICPTSRKVATMRFKESAFISVIPFWSAS